MKLSETLAKPYRPKKLVLNATTVRLDRAVTALQKKYGVAQESMDPKNLEGKLGDFEDRLLRDDWSRFPWHMASDLFRSFFNSEELENPRWSDVADVLLDTLEKTDRKNYCRAALEIYIETFNKDSSNLNRLRQVLALKDTHHIPVRPELVDDLRLFDRQDAPTLIGQELADSDRPYDLLKSWGIWSPHATGLFEQAFNRMLVEMDPDLDDLDPEAYQRVMHWLHPNSTTKAVATRAAGIDALVLPLGHVRDSGLRDEVEKFLIGTFGDPRVSPAEWAGASARTLEIVYRWMTSKSLKIFFDIIDQFEGSHMWEPRRRFWTEIDEREWIDDAWVVLNDKGAAIARELARKHEDKSFMSHGSLNFYEKEKCYFIMKVGNLTIVEGTHNFRVRIFDRDADNAPDIRGGLYERNEIHASPAADEGETHTHDVHGRWMSKTEQYMRRYR